MSLMSEDDIYKYWLEDGFGIFNSLFEENIRELRGYLSCMDGYLKAEEQREITQLEEASNKLHEAHRGEYFAEHYPYEWERIFAHHLRHSFITALMSLTEDHLNSFCNNTALLLKSPITHKDLKGSILETGWKYLKSLALFQEPKDHEWKVVVDIYKLRNAIVHNGGRIEGALNEARLKTFIRDAPGISIPSLGMLSITNEFCLFALERVETLFKELHNQQETLRLRLIEQCKAVT